MAILYFWSHAISDYIGRDTLNNNLLSHSTTKGGVQVQHSWVLASHRDLARRFHPKGSHTRKRKKRGEGTTWEWWPNIMCPPNVTLTVIASITSSNSHVCMCSFPCPILNSSSCWNCHILVPSSWLACQYKSIHNSCRWLYNVIYIIFVTVWVELLIWMNVSSSSSIWFT